MALGFTGYDTLAPVFRTYLGATGADYGPASGAAGASAFNLAGGGNIEAISNLINSIQRGATTAAEHARIPGAAGLEEQSSANIGSELRGELPGDVLNQIRQASAESGVARGTSGSPASSAEYLRALGLTSLDLTGRGQANLSAAYARNPAAPIFDPSSQLITPYQGAGLELQQQNLDLQRLEEQHRYATDLARLYSGGRGGGGGQPTRTDTSGLDYVRQAPFGYGIPESVAYSPYYQPGGTVTGDILFGGGVPSIDYSGARVVQPGSGSMYIGPTVEGSAGETAYWDPANWGPETPIEAAAGGE